MTEVSLVRLYVLRAMYLLIVVGLGLTIWPNLIGQPEDWPLMNSVVSSLLAGLSVLALLGIRYPLQMIPVLLFDLIWKMIWLTAVALPLWSAGEMDERTVQTVIDCLFGVILIPLVLPWRYVFARYGQQPGDRWRPGAHADEAVGGLR
nr:hypothetical protein [uncultured Sphingosinicella sp.]